MSRRSPRPARPAWSTTSTTGSPGDCSRSCSPRRACRWAGSGSSPRSTRPCGASGQLVTGALSDRWGRKWLIASGMWLQALALAGIAIGDSFAAWAVAAVLLGAGTAMVYPTLLASIGDVAHPAWRARSVGHLPALAGRRVRRRRPAGRHRRRRPRHPRGRLDRCRADRRVRPRGRRAHVRDPPPTGGSGHDDGSCR